MNITNIKNIADKLMVPYIIIYEIMLLARLIGAYSFVPSKFDTLVFGCIAIVGMIILFVDFLNAIKEKNFRKYNYFLIFFILALLISTFMNHSQNVISNLKLILWQIILMFVVYETAKTTYSKKIFKYVEQVLLIAVFIISLISLGMFFFRFSYTEKVHQLYYGLRMGFIENRLYGLFYDPNFGATISVITIVLSVKQIVKTHFLPKVFCYINVFIQLAYVALSGSRTALVELTIVTSIGMFFFMYQLSKNNNFYIRFAKALIVLFATAAVIVVGVSGIKSVLTHAVNALPSESTTIVVNDNNKNVSDDQEKITLKRDDVSNKTDVSNSRFQLWRSAFEIFKTTPIYGTTSRNLLSYARENLPNTFIAKTGHSPHNFFFFLLAATGILGTAPFVLFLIMKIFQTLYQLFKTKDIYYDSFIFDSMTVLAILISACFLTDIVLVNRAGGFFFWLYLGKISLSVSKGLVKRNK